MKKALLLLVIGFTVACNEPMQVTGKTDPQQTTSGTMGSVKANNEMPDRAIDSANRNRPDTARRDSL